MDVVHLAITILSLILTAHFVLFAKVSLTFEFRLDFFCKMFLSIKRQFTVVKIHMQITF